MNDKEQRRRKATGEALKLLGIKNLLFGIHDPAFPSRPEEDVGRGTPYSEGAADLLDFIASLGFTGVQFGPQGITTPFNPSPYDGSLFSRNPLSLAPSRLRGYARQPAGRGGAAVDSPASASNLVHLGHACRVMREFIDDLLLQTGPAHVKPFQRPYDEFCRQNRSWLERDALYEVLRRHYDGNNFKYWTGGSAAVDRLLFAPPAGQEDKAARRKKEIAELYRTGLETYYFIQYLLHEQHLDFKKRMHGIGLNLFADLQIGFSGRDSWYAQSFLLSGYVMGAPPSRTNPQGQPWNYPVLDPGKYYFTDLQDSQRPGPALLFLRERVAKACAEYDGLRIDHPHGLVCPWVYRSGQPDPVRAVQEGARLFASPDLADHPELADFAIVRPGQLNAAKPRYDDNWIVSLEPEQVSRYAALFAVIMQSAADRGCGINDIACEILSTQPYPIRRVMELYGLGRFRITQKADLGKDADVYRSENAAPEDWIMLGNHDTPSIWQVAENWCALGRAGQQAAYLAERLNIPQAERAQWIKRTAAEPGALAQAKCADLFVGPAKNIMIFFTDLFGIKQQYNLPGTTRAENWALRIAPGFRERYAVMAREGRALDISGALVAAMRARGEEFVQKHREVIRELEAVGV